MTHSGWPYPVTLDDRVGSADLAGPLRSLGVPVVVERMEFGDAKIIGRGPEDRPVLIGVEIKTVGDLLSCIVDNRFTAHQLPGLLSVYERTYLLVEGMLSGDEKRELIVMQRSRDRSRFAWEDAPGRWQRPWRYDDVESWRHSMDRLGARRASTSDRRGTALWISSLWSNWSKPWNDHASHLAVFHAEDLGADDPFQPYQITDKMRIAKALAPGIGRVKAEAAARHFRSGRIMVNAPESEWEKVPGIGKKLSRAIVQRVTKETEE